MRVGLRGEALYLYFKFKFRHLTPFLYALHSGCVFVPLFFVSKDVLVLSLLLLIFFLTQIFAVTNPTRFFI